MITKNEWVWYGFAGHLTVSRRCTYHLCTRIGDYLVSTVGAYYPMHSDKMDTIGVGKDDFYETMVFPCDGEDEYGNPNCDLSEIECHRYADSITAERGHRAICERIAANGAASQVPVAPATPSRTFSDVAAEVLEEKNDLWSKMAGK